VAMEFQSSFGMKATVLDPAEARTLLDTVSTHAGLRDRALIGLMVYSFARIGAALGMAVEDVYTQNRRLWVRLREKGGKRHAMPCHHNLEEYLTAYLDGAGLRGDPKGPLFRTIGRGAGKLTRTGCRRRTPMRWSAGEWPAAGIATAAVRLRAPVLLRSQRVYRHRERQHPGRRHRALFRLLIRRTPEAPAVLRGRRADGSMRDSPSHAAPLKRPATAG